MAHEPEKGKETRCRDRLPSRLRAASGVPCKVPPLVRRRSGGGGQPRTIPTGLAFFTERKSRRCLPFALAERSGSTTRETGAPERAPPAPPPQQASQAKQHLWRAALSADRWEAARGSGRGDAREARAAAELFRRAGSDLKRKAVGAAQELRAGRPEFAFKLRVGAGRS